MLTTDDEEGDNDGEDDDSDSLASFIVNDDDDSDDDSSEDEHRKDDRNAHANRFEEHFHASGSEAVRTVGAGRVATLRVRRTCHTLCTCVPFTSVLFSLKPG